MNTDSQPNPTLPNQATDEVVVFTPTGPREVRAATIRSHDFRQAGFLGPSELRRIRLRHEQFIRSLASRLAMLLRLEFTLQMSKLHIVGYQKFIENLASPTHITLFKTEPLKGVGLLVIPPRLGLMLVDRLLGGPGQKPEADRDLSEIEVALVDQVATVFLNEWCNHWPEMGDLRASLLGHENNSRFLQTASPETAMLILTMDAGLGDQLELVQLAFPYPTVEPLVRLLTPALPETDAGPVPIAKPQWNAQFDDVKVPISAKWQGLKVSAGQINSLKSGDVLLLEPEAASQVQLRLSHIPKFLCRPGTCGGKWAVQLTSPIPNT